VKFGLMKLAIIFLALFACNVNTRTLPRSYQQQLSTTVRIETVCIYGEPYKLIDKESVTLTVHAKSGTGALLDGRHVLTAYHVVDCDDSKTLSVKLSNDRRYQVHLFAIDKDNDLAILELETDDVLSVVPPTIGDLTSQSVCMVTARPTNLYKCGRLLINLKEVSKNKDTRLTIKTEPGNSGGPVYDSMGRLVGITTKFITVLTMDNEYITVGGRMVTLYDKNIINTINK
jgi:S1-C subfamily serine protease